MKKSELSEDQLKHLKLFSLILEFDGWEDSQGIEAQFDANQEVMPEGVRSYQHGDKVLEAQFHAPVNMISLSIWDPSCLQKVGLFFLYEKSPEKIFEWMAAVKEQLSPLNYHELLERLQDVCPTILAASASSVGECELKPVFSRDK